MVSVDLTTVVVPDVIVVLSVLDSDMVGVFKGCVITEGDCSVTLISVNKDRRYSETHLSVNRS